MGRPRRKYAAPRRLATADNTILAGHSQVVHLARYAKDAGLSLPGTLFGRGGMTISFLFTFLSGLLLPTHKRVVIFWGINEIASMATPTPHNPRFRNKGFTGLVHSVLELQRKLVPKLKSGFTREVLWVTVPATPLLTAAQDRLRERFNEFLTRNFHTVSLTTEPRESVVLRKP